ncbi:DMT family transporter [Microbacterium sp. CIAB417]|uniref:EamA family transporter n=1 Tax=Microbacterium sp. CIAB417 TaxID=2860287 RepID=UPI001FADDA3B|nr:EamA family transporter [Microbacterium sp. CIAB417]
MPPSTPSGPYLGAALVFGSCVSLSFGAAVAAQLFPALGAWGVTALRLGIAALVMILVVRPAVRGWTRRQWRASILFGLTLAGMNGAFYAAIERIPLGPAVAIEFLGPLVLSALLTRRLRDAGWLALAVIGIGLLGVDGLIGADPLDPLGVLFALVAAAFWALYIRASAHAGAVIPGSGGLAVAFVVASAVLLPFGVPAAVAVAADPALLALAAVTSLLGSIIPYTLELAALRRLPQRVFGILLSLEPATATFAGWVVLGQHARALRLVAIGFVVTASIGVSVARGRTSRRGAAERGPLSDPAAP